MYATLVLPTTFMAVVQAKEEVNNYLEAVTEHGPEHKVGAAVGHAWLGLIEGVLEEGLAKLEGEGNLRKGAAGEVVEFKMEL